MNSSTFKWSQLVGALIVAAGIAAVWGLLAAWTSFSAAAFLHADAQVYENLRVAMDGTPVIESRSFRNYLDVSYRTLDGQPLPNQREEWLTPGSLPGPVKPPGLLEIPPGWSARVAGLTDSQRPPVAWYLIRNDRQPGRAYLVGYDEFSNLLVGYIGRGGFRSAIPLESDWFDLGRRRFDYQSGAVASTGHIQYGGRGAAYSYYVAGQQGLPAWHVFLMDGDRVQRIDLRDRGLRTVYESPGLVSIAVLNEPRAATDEDAVEIDETSEEDNSNGESAAGVNSSASGETVARIAVRTADRVVVLDPEAGTQHEYVLPEALGEQAFDAYASSDSQLLVVWRDSETPFEIDLQWLAADGSVARQEFVQLDSYRGGSKAEALAIGVLSVPTSIAWLVGVFFGTPLTMLQNNLVSDYYEGVARGLEFGGWPLVAVTLFGVALAACTYYFQRKYRRPATGIWCAFVLLLGWPGFLAYWIEQRRPKMETCGECGALVPRDRDACAACNETFPEPPRIGTEIFA